ncbi:MAG: hypothetical protein ACRCWJ_02055 [Casimicrobium sp.]
MLPPEIRYLAATSALVTGGLLASDMRGACQWDNGSTIWRIALQWPLSNNRYLRERWDIDAQSRWDGNLSRWDAIGAVWDYYDRKPWDGGISPWDNGDCVFDAITERKIARWIVRRASRGEHNLRSASGARLVAYRYRQHTTPPTPAYEATKQRMRNAQNAFAADRAAARAFALTLPNPDRLSAYHLYVRWHLNNH